jgi:hypothetical protein
MVHLQATNKLVEGPAHNPACVAAGCCLAQI